MAIVLWRQLKSSRKKHKIDNKIFKKIDVNILRSVTFPINEYHDKIKRHMPSFLSQD